MDETLIITMTGVTFPEDWKSMIKKGEPVFGDVQCEVIHTVRENGRKWERRSVEMFPERCPIGWCWQHVAEKAKEERRAFIAKTSKTR